MALTHVEEKYINKALADALERALTYKKLAYSKTRSARDKATWKALFVESARAYNFMLKTLAFVATSKLAKEQELIIDSALGDKGFGLLSEEEMNQIIEDSYGITYLQKQADLANLRRDYAGVFAVTTKTVPQVRQALITLAKYKALDKFVDMNKLLSQEPPETKALPRGNTIPRADDSESNTLSEIEAAIAKVEINNSPDDSSIAQKSKLLSILED